jgi:hypothetical protein
MRIISEEACLYFVCCDLLAKIIDMHHALHTGHADEGIALLVNDPHWRTDEDRYVLRTWKLKGHLRDSAKNKILLEAVAISWRACRIAASNSALDLPSQLRIKLQAS